MYFETQNPFQNYKKCFCNKDINIKKFRKESGPKNFFIIFPTIKMLDTLVSFRQSRCRSFMTNARFRYAKPRYLKLRTSNLHERVLSYDSLPESQCNGKSNHLVIFQPISKQFQNFNWWGVFLKVELLVCICLKGVSLSSKPSGKLIVPPIFCF